MLLCFAKKKMSFEFPFFFFALLEFRVLLCRVLILQDTKVYAKKLDTHTPRRTLLLKRLNNEIHFMCVKSIAQTREKEANNVDN